MNDTKKNEGMNPSDNLKPAELPVKCPLCMGFGTFSHGKVLCNGCSGKGYVMVKAEDKNEN